MGAAYRFWLEWVTCAGLGLCLFGVIGVLLLRTTAAGLSGSAFLTKQRASGFSLGTLTPLLVVGFLLAGLWWATLRGFGGFGAAGWLWTAAQVRWALFTFFSLAFCLYLYVGVLARRRLRFAAELLLVFFLLGILWVHINLQANPLTFLLFLELLVGAFFLVVVYAAVLPRSEGCETSATSAATLRTLVVFLWVNALATLALCAGFSFLSVEATSLELVLLAQQALSPTAEALFAFGVLAKMGLAPLQLVLVALYRQLSPLTLAFYLTCYYVFALWLIFNFFVAYLAVLTATWAWVAVLAVLFGVCGVVGYCSSQDDLRVFFAASSLINLGLFTVAALLV